MPAPQAELVAVDFTHRELSRIRAHLLSEQGESLSTAYQWVRLDAKGMPANRFFESWGDEPLTLRVALVAAVPKGTERRPSSSMASALWR